MVVNKSTYWFCWCICGSNAARVSQVVGAKANPANFLLMHAMGPNVAGVIGTAVAAGTMLAMLSSH